MVLPEKSFFLDSERIVCPYAGASCKVKVQNLPLARFARVHRVRRGGFGCWPDLLRGKDQTKTQSANADGSGVGKALSISLCVLSAWRIPAGAEQAGKSPYSVGDACTPSCL